MKALALALALLLPACGPDGGAPWPDLSALYRVDGATVICDDPDARTDTPTGVACTWRNVTHEGAPACSALVLFLRDDEAAPWRPVVIAGPCD